MDMKRADLSPRQKVYGDILTTAVEGGSDYWAFFTRYRWEDEKGTLLSPTVTVHPEDNNDAHPVGVADIAKAMNTLNGGGGFGDKPAPEWWIRKWRKAYRECPTGDWDFDADDADVVLQVAIFGEVVYG